MATPARLQELIEPIVTGLGLELFDLHFTGSTLSVVVDQRPSGEREPGGGRSGVDLGALTKVTRAVSRALDEADPITGHYSLEVSSPGLERPLRTPAHFTGAVGEVITVKAVAGFDGPRRLRGELVRASGPDDDEASVDVRDETSGDVVTVPYDAIEKARTVFEWGPPPKPERPGKGDKPTGAGSAKTAKTTRATRRKGGGPASGAAPSRSPSGPSAAPGAADEADPHPPTTGDEPPEATSRARPAGGGGDDHDVGGSATPSGADAMINGDDKKVSAT